MKFLQNDKMTKELQEGTQIVIPREYQ